MGFELIKEKTKRAKDQQEPVLQNKYTNTTAVSSKGLKKQTLNLFYSNAR